MAAAKHREKGPRVERRGIGTMRHVGGGTYEQTFDPDGPQADCWVYEDLVYIHKRHIAAFSFDRDEMTMSQMTYDEMRPGCYDPKARVDDMELNWVEASLSFPSFPRFCGQTFLEAKDRELAEACVYAYNDWMVDEWCGDSGGSLIPLPIIPLWDVELAAAEVRRNASRGERAADVWLEHRAWGGVRDIVPEPPSTYYYRQVFGCFFRDRHGIESLETVGVDNTTFETDYPHTDSTWPHTKKVAQELMAGLSDDVVHKLVRGNAIRM